MKVTSAVLAAFFVFTLGIIAGFFAFCVVGRLIVIASISIDGKIYFLPSNSLK